MERSSKNEALQRKAFATEASIAALEFLAADPERLRRFLALSGLGPDNLRQAAGDPSFLGAVLDYLAGDEPLLIAFASHRGWRPADVVRARDALAEPALEETSEPLAQPSHERCDSRYGSGRRGARGVSDRALDSSAE